MKLIWKKYISTLTISIFQYVLLDTIFTYFQDRAGMTHYLFFVGGPGSGKSNNLEVFHFLAYRNMTSTGITPANIYRFYGGREQGLGTICEDEANDLDQNELKMTFYKNGYTKGRPVFRMDDNNSGDGDQEGQIPKRYFTYGWKAFAAERLPDSVIAAGFMQRVLVMNCTYGLPEYDITEVTDPMGDQDFTDLLQELEDTRNLLLVFRLLHHDDKFPNIKLNIVGREKQLFKPILRIFQKTETQKELEPVISNYVNEKRVANADSLNVFLYSTVIRLIKQVNAFDLTSKNIWEAVFYSLDGEFLYKGNTTYETVEYGPLTQKKIIRICKEVFGAKPSKDGQGNRGLVFDKRKLDQLSNLYNLSLEIQVTETETETETETDVTADTADTARVQNVGLDKHFIDESKDKSNESNDVKNTKIEEEIDENYDEIGEKQVQDTDEYDNTSPSPSINPPDVPYVPHNGEDEDQSRDDDNRSLTSNDSHYRRQGKEAQNTNTLSGIQQSRHNTTRYRNLLYKTNSTSQNCKRNL